MELIEVYRALKPDLTRLQVHLRNSQSLDHAQEASSDGSSIGVRTKWIAEKVGEPEGPAETFERRHLIATRWRHVELRLLLLLILRLAALLVLLLLLLVGLFSRRLGIIVDVEL